MSSGTNSDQGPRSEFTDVDHAQSPADYVRILDAQRSMPFIQQYKQRVRVLLDLHSGQQVLDAGTGTGEDAQEMAKLVAPGGQVVGLDVSQIMIDEAKRRMQDASLPLRFVQGDIQHLPFENATFDRCYADRIFIHLPAPQLALSELVRVTRLGGQILIAEGDHETQVLDTPYPEVTRRFFRFRNDGMQRLRAILPLFALALSGRPGERLLVAVGLPRSANPLLRLVKQAATPPIRTPEGLGVDDVACRRAKTYGTILVESCDQSRHRPAHRAYGRRFGRLA